MDLEEIDSLLIVKPSSMGDIVHALPVLPILKAWRPELKLRWVANPEWAPLLEDNGYIDEVIHFSRKKFGSFRGIFALPRWVRGLRKGRNSRSEVVLDLQGLLRSALIGRARGAQQLIGYKDAREGAPLFYQRKINAKPSSPHEVDRHLSFIEELGIALSEEDKSSALCPLPEGEKVPRLRLPSRFILLHPYARGDGKSLRHEQIKKLCLEFDDIPIILVGHPKELKDTAQHRALPDSMIDLRTKTSLSQLIYLCRQASFIISVDSGPLHLASAVAGDRLLGIYTWSDPRRVGPYHPDATVWKAGTITRRQQINESEAKLSREPSSEDLASIADWVKLRINAA